LANDLYGPPPHPHWMLDAGSQEGRPESLDGQPVIIVSTETASSTDVDSWTDDAFSSDAWEPTPSGVMATHSLLSTPCYPDISAHRLVHRPDVVRLARLVLEQSGAASGTLYPWRLSVDRQAPAAPLHTLSLARTVWESATGESSRVIEVARTRLPTPIGEFVAVVLKWPGESRQFLVLMSADHAPTGELFIHHACPLGDTFIAQACDCRYRFEDSARKVVEDGGILVYFNHADSPFTTDGDFRCSRSTSPELSVEAEIVALSALATLTDGQLATSSLSATIANQVLFDRLIACARSDDFVTAEVSAE
jgi:hypothetical protein